MKNKILHEICSYIDFLRECGFSVMISGFNRALNDVLPVLLTYEPHLPNICSYLKSKPEFLCKCIENKTEIIKNCPKAHCFRSCYAGVWEFIFPIWEGDELITCVSISGYRRDESLKDSMYEMLRERFGKKYINLYNGLSPDIPDTEKILRFTDPLKYMFYELYHVCNKPSDASDSYSPIYIEALKFMNDHFAEIKSISEISQALNYSASYLRYVFLKESGKTITEHLRKIRLRHASNLLRFTPLSITRIAEECGFPDSSYFSTVFKKEFKTSPCNYRKQN